MESIIDDYAEKVIEFGLHLHQLNKRNAAAKASPASLVDPSHRRILHYLLQQIFLFPFLRHYCSHFQVSGLAHLERLEGQCVFVSNHSSHADVAIILCALPQKHRSHLAIAAAADYFYTKKWLGPLVTLMLNTFPFDRSHPRKGLLKGKQVLQSGQSLLIFPEGTRSRSAEKPAFKRGFAALASQMGLPIVPVRIEGSHELLPKGSKWPRRASVHICFGEPVYPSGESSTDLAHLVEEKVHDLTGVA